MFKKWMFLLALLLPFECNIYPTLLLDTPAHVPEPRSAEVSIAADQSWQRSGIQLQSGEQITIEVLSGLWNTYPEEAFFDGAGGASGLCTGAACVGFVENMPKGMLIGRIGGGEPFPIGNFLELSADRSGTLELRMNDPGTEDNAGALIVLIRVE